MAFWGEGSRGPRSSWRSNRSFKVCVNRKGVITHSFLTNTVSLILVILVSYKLKVFYFIEPGQNILISIHRIFIKIG